MGANGHGKVVLGILRALSLDVAGFYDDAPSLHGVLVMGICSCLGLSDRIFAGGQITDSERYCNGAIRKRVVAVCTKAFVDYLGASRSLESDQQPRLILEQLFVLGACVATRVSVGCHAVLTRVPLWIMTVLLGISHSHLSRSPSGRQRLLVRTPGLESAVRSFRVCESAPSVLAGAGSTIIQDVPDNAVVMGSPRSLARYPVMNLSASWPYFALTSRAALRVLRSGRVNYWTGQECHGRSRRNSRPYAGRRHAYRSR